jgi:hypothetical protein
MTGQNTIKTFTTGETVTQATTGSTATLISGPSSTGNIVGSWGGVGFTFNETVTQATTGVTCTEQAYSGSNPATAFNCNNFSGTADNSHVWTGGTSGSTFTPSAVPVFNQVTFYISAPTGAPDNSHNWTGGTSAAVFVPNLVPTGTNWTVNQFAGMLVGVHTGTNSTCYAPIASNTATVLTITPPWKTQYPTYVQGATTVGQCTAPDSTSTFVIEPNWNHGTIVSGGMTLAYLSEYTLAGGAATVGSAPASGAQGRVVGSILAGDQLWIANGVNQATMILSDVSVTRPDWFSTTGSNYPQGYGPLNQDWDVHVTLPSGLNYINWSYPSLTGIPNNAALHRTLGTIQLCWETGTINTSIPPASTSANEVCLGGRSDPSASTIASRNILEFTGMFGRAAPVPNAGNSYSLTDQAGTDTDITGGPSTGAGNGGAINFWTSNPGGSGTTVNSGLKRWLVSPAGHFFAGLDNTYDIGAAGANRPRNLYIAGKATLGSGSTVSISTGTASNADLAGELTFSGGTTSTSYTFTGTYVSAPECVITPRFDVGSSGRIWISTLSTTTLQLSAAAAETGTVGYICIGRN